MNNDRFKFRIWDEDRNKYLDGRDMDCYKIWELASRIKGQIVEQCTGLKDKNNKLIFEGDVVTIHRDVRTFYIKWFDNMQFGFSDTRSDCIKLFRECYDTILNGFPMDKHIEIIGTIHE